MLQKLKALEIYFHFCHVNSVNGLKGPDSAGRTSKSTCICSHIKIREKETVSGQERDGEQRTGVRREVRWGKGNTERSYLTRALGAPTVETAFLYAFGLGFLTEICSIILRYL